MLEEAAVHHQVVAGSAAVGGSCHPWAGRSVWTAGFIQIVSSGAGPLAVDRNRTDREQHA